MEISDVKITVLKKLETGEVFSQFAGADVGPLCPRVEVGQEFVSKGLQMPEGFCSWAWADIQRDVVHIALGGSFPWIKQEGTMISCCTDGLRPVIFKLEAL